MKINSIFVVIKSEKDLANWEKIYKLLSGKIDFNYLTNFNVANNKITSINLYDDYIDFKSNFFKNSKDLLSLHNKVSKKYRIDPNTYKSDERFFLGSSKEYDLIFEQYYLTLKLKNIFKNAKNSILLSAGGGSLIRCVCFNMAKSFSIPSYRMLSANHMSIERNGMRLFFVDNDFNELPSKALFSKHNKKEIKIYAQNFLRSIKKKNYALDSYSRNIARLFRESNNLFGAIFDFIKTCYFLLLGDNLSAKKLKSKYVCFFRSYFFNFLLYKQKLQNSNKYIIFPLNVPDDAQLRLRAKSFVDTEAVIKIIASNIPYGYNLLIKPHPGNPGMLPVSIVRRVVKKYPFIKFVNPSKSLFDLIKNSQGLIAVNSNSALEAAILKKPTIYLGRSYLASLPNCIKFSSFDEIDDVINQLLNHSGYKKNMNYDANLVKCMSSLYENTFPYFDKDATKYNQNIELIADAILALTSEIS
jgi:hypothetical protein